MWKCGYRYLSSEKLHKICQLVPTLQIREQLVNIWFFSAVTCSFLNASIHFLWTLNYAMTEYHVILLTANFSICKAAILWSYYDELEILDIISPVCNCIYREPESLERQPSIWALQAQFDVFGTSLDRGSDYVLRSSQSNVNEEEKAQLISYKGFKIDVIEKQMSD